MSLHLIDLALQKSREARTSKYLAVGYTDQPLFPDARRSVLYLRIRENLMAGSRDAVKILSDKNQRSMAHGILTQALEDIFHYGDSPEIRKWYDMLLDKTIGDH
jgi:hypothetical protein